MARKITGVKADIAIATAREFADNAEKTKGRSMIIMGGGINHWYHADVIYRTILNLIMFCGTEGVNGGGWAHYVGQEKLRPVEGWGGIMTANDWSKAPRLQMVHLGSTLLQNNIVLTASIWQTAYLNWLNLAIVILGITMY